MNFDSDVDVFNLIWKDKYNKYSYKINLAKKKYYFINALWWKLLDSRIMGGGWIIDST